jgi:hypothetical protein
VEVGRDILVSSFIDLFLNHVEKYNFIHPYPTIRSFNRHYLLRDGIFNKVASDKTLSEVGIKKNGDMGQIRGEIRLDAIDVKYSKNLVR